ncbi:MAG: hypothetical protein QOI05_3925 [Bradyrhizobium sp.]|nr:hypothetical protein [Bradyrhizobium sp.]
MDTLEEETVTLYLGLKEGERADFEVVGLSAAAFAEAVKEISYILEPGLEVRLEFDSGTEGSLKLKAIIKTLKTPEGRRAALVSVVATVGLMLINDVRGYGFGKLLDEFLAPEQRKELSDNDIKRIAQAVIDINNGKIAKPQVQEMYKQLERDTNIESVGAITKPDDKPVQPVPRSCFSEKAGIAPPIETSTRTRTVPSTERLTLISPVLLPTDRVWRFRSPIGEFGYFIKDEKFLDDALHGRLHLGLKQGIQITAQIETKEEFEGAVWIPKRREIIKVVRVHKRAAETGDLFAQPKKPKKSTSKPRKPKNP